MSKTQNSITKPKNKTPKQLRWANNIDNSQVNGKKKTLVEVKEYQPENLTIDTIDPITEITKFYYTMKLINEKISTNDETYKYIEDYEFKPTQYNLYNKKKNEYETDNTLTHYSREYSSLYCIVLYLHNEIKIFNANFLNNIDVEDFVKYMLKYNCNKIELICNNIDNIKNKYIDIIDFDNNNYFKNNKLLYHSLKELYKNINIIKSVIFNSKDNTEIRKFKNLLTYCENKLIMLKIIATYNENLETIGKITFIRI
jgi:hypothetical protein